MAALTAMKSMRQRLTRRQGGLTYEVEVVAQHAAELPLPPGARAQFVLKRRNRLCVTDPADIDGGGGVEWNTRCTQTATLFKEPGSSAGGWRPKEFVFKVQAVQGEDGNFKQQQQQQAGGSARTVAKAALDLSQFCGAEPFGPKQLVLPLRPSGVLHLSVRTQWLQHFDREADSLTDISYLSLAQSAATSLLGTGGSAGLPACETEVEQDLSGFDGTAAGTAAAGGGIAGTGLSRSSSQGAGSGTGIKAVYLPGGTAAVGAPSQQQQLKRARSALGMRLPRRGESSKDLLPQQQQQQQQHPHEQKQPMGGTAAFAAGGDCSFQFDTAAAAEGGTVSSTSSSTRRPPGASKLLIPESSTTQPGGMAGGTTDAATPTLLLRPSRTAGSAPAHQQAASHHQQRQQGQQQGQQQEGVSAAVGLPPECWSPINLQEAVERLYDSEEEPTPKPSVMGTVRRMFGGARNTTPQPPPSTTARQLHEKFGTPAPSPPRRPLDPTEVATIDRENSLSALRKRCKRLLAERDEARAEGYAEAALAVEQGVEMDRLRRSKAMLLCRLQSTEEQLLATFRDEAASDLIQALAAARVEAAQLEFQVLDLQGQLRRRDAAIDKLRTQLTRAEAKYRASVNALSPGAKDGPPSPPPAGAATIIGSSPSPTQHPAGAAPSLSSASSTHPATNNVTNRSSTAGSEADGGRQQRRRGGRGGSGSPVAVRPLLIHDNPLATPDSAGGAAVVTTAAVAAT